MVKALSAAREAGLNDYVIQVDTALISGPNNGIFGLFFRAKDGKNLYKFAINGAGQFAFMKIIDGKAMAQFTPTPSLRPGNAVNTLKVAVKGDTFDFYANDVKIGTYTDATLTGGTMGFDNLGAQGGPLEVAFSNLKVWTNP